MANEDKSKGEVILELGAEGGSVTIYRVPLDSGGWEFHTEHGERFQSLDDTIRSMMTPSESWVFLSPISIHPDYRDGVMRLVRNVATKLSEASFKNWKTNNRRRWLQKCRQEPINKTKDDKDLFSDPTTKPDPRNFDQHIPMTAEEWEANDAVIEELAKEFAEEKRQQAKKELGTKVDKVDDGE